MERRWSQKLEIKELIRKGIRIPQQSYRLAYSFPTSVISSMEYMLVLVIAEKGVRVEFELHKAMIYRLFIISSRYFRITNSYWLLKLIALSFTANYSSFVKVDLCSVPEWRLATFLLLSCIIRTQVIPWSSFTCSVVVWSFFVSCNVRTSTAWGLRWRLDTLATFSGRSRFATLVDLNSILWITSLKLYSKQNNN